jgi:DDE family transposase
VFANLQQEQILRLKIEAFSLDSTLWKVHPDGTGALKKRTASHREIARRMEHQNSSGCRECSNGNSVLLVARRSARRSGRPATAAGLRSLPVEVLLVMDRAYESDETRQLVLELNIIPVVPPKSNRREPWVYDRELS